MNEYPGDEVIVEVHHRLERSVAGLGNHAEGVAVHGSDSLIVIKIGRNHSNMF